MILSFNLKAFELSIVSELNSNIPEFVLAKTYFNLVPEFVPAETYFSPGVPKRVSKLATEYSVRAIVQ